MRGHASQFWRVFDASKVPMVMVDNHRRYLAANGAARLFLRLSLRELLARRIDDLTPPHRQELLSILWQRLMSDGSVSGLYDVGFEGGGIERISYCAIANALPGQHLVVFMPAAWADDELGTTDDAPAVIEATLSHRELEVLSLVAAGAHSPEIARTLHISPATVRTHTRNTLVKLNARNRAHAVALAMSRGMIDPAMVEINLRGSSAA